MEHATPTHGAQTQPVHLDKRQSCDGDVHAGMTPELYLTVKRHLVCSDPDAQRLIDWSLRDTRPPASPEDLASEVTWIILCAGRTAQSARTIETRVLAAIRAGQPVLSAYGHRARAAAIERAWDERVTDFEALQAVLATGEPRALVEWCGSLPGVGPTTRYQLAKSFGAATVKPDLWMARFAGIADHERMSRTDRYHRCQSMAERISQATGDPVPLVDTISWLAGNKGLLHVLFDPHTITFRPQGPRRGSIY